MSIYSIFLFYNSMSESRDVGEDMNKQERRMEKVVIENKSEKDVCRMSDVDSKIALIASTDSCPE